MRARITLRTNGTARFGFLSVDRSSPHNGHPKLELEDSPVVVLDPADLGPDHRIVVHGDRDDAVELLDAADQAGFHVMWEGDGTV